MRVNVGTIGHIDHRKTTLAGSLARVSWFAASAIEAQPKIIGSHDDCQEVSPYPDRAKNQRRKAAWKAKLKAAQRKAFNGDVKP